MSAEIINSLASLVSAQSATALRSGGKTLITFFFDSCYTWLINFPIAFVLSRYTALPLPIVYLFVNGVDLLKCIIGFILVKKGVWVNNIVASSQDVPQAD